MKYKVFIIDDMLFMRYSLKKMIDSIGEYEIIGEAENGRDALIKLSTLKPDIITLDLTMPEMDGIEFLENYKNTNNSKIVIVTALGQEYKLKKAVELGAADYIIKPYDLKKIKEKFYKLTRGG